MPTTDTTPEHSIHVSETRSGSADSKGMPGEGAAPELDFVHRDRVSASTDFRVSQPLCPPAWHRPLAEALLTGDPTRVHEAIVRAQRAILNRYLEWTCGREAQPEEAADLENAIEILQALERTTDRTRYQGRHPGEHRLN
jgi:hypothetical protein